MIKEVAVQTRGHAEFVDITAKVQRALGELGVRDGLINVFVPHTTAAVTINENTDPDVLSDISRVLDRLVPWKSKYRHSEGNSAAHIKASLIGSSIQIPAAGGRLQLGHWQGIFFCEFDGPRRRTVRITALPTKP